MLRLKVWVFLCLGEREGDSNFSLLFLPRPAVKTLRVLQNTGLPFHVSIYLTFPPRLFLQLLVGGRPFCKKKRRKNGIFSSGHPAACRPGCASWQRPRLRPMAPTRPRLLPVRSVSGRAGGRGGRSGCVLALRSTIAVRVSRQT